jgi:lysophospholipase L1-like esterase
MRILSVLMVLACVFAAAGETATAPAKRTVEYPWMSVARWDQMHDGFLKRAKEGKIDVLFLGDSITEGWAGAGRAAWEKNYTPLNAANFGIGGDMTQQVLWRITEGKELEGISPKVVVMMIGTNNFGLGGHKPDDVVKGIQVLLETIQKKLPQTKILLLGIFPRDAKPDTGMRKNIAAVNEQISKWDNGKNLRYLDIGPKFLQPDGTLTKEIMPDFLHLSPKGYEIWAESIQALLTELLK